VIEVERTVNASGNVSIGTHMISAGLPLAGRRVTLRLDGPVAHILSGGILARTRKTAEVRVEANTYLIIVEPGITIASPRTTSRDIGGTRHRTTAVTASPRLPSFPGGKSIAAAGDAHYRYQPGGLPGMAAPRRRTGMDKALTDRLEQQVRQAFPEHVIARVQVLQYGDDPEVEPGQAAMRVFFDWPGRSECGQADPKTVHRFATANAAALGVLREELPHVIGWIEFRPEGQAAAASPHTLAYRITGRSRPAPAGDEASADLTPVMARLGAAELATLDTLITAGVVSSRAEGLRWALSRLREHPAYAQLQQQPQVTEKP